MTIRIGIKKVGTGQPCFIVAEAGVNHNGKLLLAKKLVDAAKTAGADAVKFQTFRSEKLVSARAPKAQYQKKNSKSESQLEMIKKLELSFEAFARLSDYCRRKGILFLSTPFDEESADLLDSLGVPAFKIGSGEITNLPLLRQVARKKKPVILSTGMSTLAEVKVAVSVLRAAGCRELILLQCVSNYPADVRDINLRAMKTMKEAFRVPVGFSDHTLGIEISLAAAALEACVIEKHLTLDRKMKGPDHAASLEEEEFACLVNGVRNIEKALGDGRKKPSRHEADTAVAVRKSLVAAKDIAKGRRLTNELVIIQRPGNGMKPATLKKVLGKKLKRNIKAGSMFAPGMFK